MNNLDDICKQLETLNENLYINNMIALQSLESGVVEKDYGFKTNVRDIRGLMRLVRDK